MAESQANPLTTRDLLARFLAPEGVVTAVHQSNSGASDPMSGA